ncbi:MAG TPA: NAD/NADP octopine/nopaline dehydrogenase family protein [Beijerinckiaceae bacterium]|nr:NAD/NADP octopine/nopaline dehydrogenase family protein [Rhodoblastus sp.]MCB9998605.1 NAD/NADP octopine/nopaline dehydrogenase family protein [Methylobacteriaceae bacterium]HPG02308.1 NAD/NADP octopine/nopaline dehydrogenase family protein [Rhodoblastus sp.]HRY03676.1 NAD/NADP octopine/nopaline dehydrogenase family protein [Beijerinckiaceae bacterium]
MKIAVLGGGNGSFAAAVDFTLAGHEVALVRREQADVDAHLADGGTITRIDGKGRQTATIASITADIAAAVRGAALILCPAPAFAQNDLARRVAPLLEPGQVVYLPPGTFGSYIFAKAAHDAGRAKGVCFAETGTLPWLARKQGPYEVRISGRGVRLPTGVFPLVDKAQAFEVIGRAFPRAIEDCGDILSGALMNAGPIIHPPLITMNAGPLEHFDRWDIHKEGTQPSIRRVTDQLDAERMAVREAFGYGAPHFPLADHYAKRAWMYEAEAHDTLTDSGDWRERIVLTQHRYMLEDTRIGLSFLISCAELAGVAAPLAKSFLSIGSAIVGEDFMQTGRTRKTLGLDGMSKDALQSFLSRGFA